MNPTQRHAPTCTGSMRYARSPAGTRNATSLWVLALGSKPRVKGRAATVRFDGDNALVSSGNGGVPFGESMPLYLSPWSLTRRQQHHQSNAASHFRVPTHFVAAARALPLSHTPTHTHTRTHTHTHAHTLQSESAFRRPRHGNTHSDCGGMEDAQKVGKGAGFGAARESATATPTAPYRCRNSGGVNVSVYSSATMVCIQSAAERRGARRSKRGGKTAHIGGWLFGARRVEADN